MVERTQVTRQRARVRTQTFSRPTTTSTSQPVSRTEPQTATESRISKAQNQIEIEKRNIARLTALEEQARQRVAQYIRDNPNYFRVKRKQNILRSLADERRKLTNRRQSAQRQLETAQNNINRALQGLTSKKQEQRLQQEITQIVRRPATKGGTFQVKIEKGKTVPTKVIGGGSDLDKLTILAKAQKSAVKRALQRGVSPAKLQKELAAFYSKELRQAKAGEQEQYRRIAFAFAKDFKKAQEKANIAASKQKTLSPLTSVTGRVKARENAKSQVRRFLQTSGKTSLSIPENLYLKAAIKKKDRTVVSNAQVAGWTFVGSLVQQAYDVKDLPKVIGQVARDPSILKNIPSAVKSVANDRINLIKTSPAEAVGVIGADIVFLKGTGAVLRVLGKIGTKVRVVLDPKFIGALEAGKNLGVPIGNKVYKLKVVARIPKETLIKQISRAGTRVNAISSQADALLTVLRGKRVIKKPVGDTSKLSATGKKLLKKFDDGVATTKEIQALDRALRAAGSKGILERSFFADPVGRIRPSRLGVNNKTASLIDLLTGNITFRSAKPQILFFPNVLVQQFPKSLRPIANKIKQGKPLTAFEERQLLKFQLKRSGQFKPLGFISREAELTLAPNEILKKVKVVARTNVSGKVVPIVETKVIKAPKDIEKLITKLRRGTITTEELRLLNRKLIRKTGFDYSVTRSTKKVVSLKRLSVATAASLARYTSKVPRASKKVSRKTTSKKSVRKSVKRKSPVKVSRRTSVKRVSRKPSRTSVSRRSISKSRVSPTSRVSRTSPSKPSRVSRAKGTGKSGKTAKPKGLPQPPTQKRWKGGYAAYVKQGKRWLRVNTDAVAKTRAAALGRYVTENSTSVSYVIRRVTGEVSRGKTRVPRVLQSQFRSPKRRSKLPIKVRIERRRYRINTKGEKRGLKAAQLISQVRKKRKTTKKRTTKRKKR